MKYYSRYKDANDYLDVNNGMSYMNNYMDMNDLINTYYSSEMSNLSLKSLKDVILKFDYDYHEAYYHCTVKRSLFTNSKYKKDLVNNRRNIEFI